jgi:hypothetical protein
VGGKELKKVIYELILKNDRNRSHHMSVNMAYVQFVRKGM